ncbi:ATP-binding protein [Acidovorax sp. FG27]|uniref:hybrid sensor histidine kinase/response regulator n=1 Tax=Acidovorax sp. FG27 TaxID=3133652 RepID=UPI0030E87911
MQLTPHDEPTDPLPWHNKEEQLRLAIEAADIGLWDVDIATGKVYWPERVKAMFGMSPGRNVTLDDFAQALHPEDAPRVLDAFAAAQDPLLRTVYDVEYRAIGREDGVVRWVAAKGRGVFDETGRCVRAIGTVIDITARKRAEALQRQVQERVQLLGSIERATRPLIDAADVMQVTAQLLGEHLGATRCAYTDVEPAGDQFTILGHWSEAGVPPCVGVYPLSLFGARAIAHLRRGHSVVVNDVDQESSEDSAVALCNAMGIKALVCAALVKGGRLVAMMAVQQASPRQWSEAELRIISDVVERCWTHIERVRDAAMLREQDRRKDEFLVTLAHELRNPIAPMLYAVALMKRDRDPERQARRVEVIERQANHMVRLVDDLLDVSRISRGLIELKREVVDLAPLLTQALEAAAPLVESAGHHLSVQLPAQQAPVHADPTRLVQVLTNLLNNACKYTPDGGDIRLAAWVERDRVVIELSDNGMGIPPQDQKRLFQLFTQLSHTGQKAHGGLGIGLSLVRSLVEMHGGTVGVRSEGLGRGSTFQVELPLAVGDGAVQEPSTATQSAQPGRVLVVEDNSDGLATLVELITARGHTVQGAADGLQALRLVEHWKPQLVLLDIGMPVMDGYAVAQRLRADQSLAGVRIIALTGWGTRQDREKTASAGFDDHITKPVDPERLLALIDGWMGSEATVR